jgi:hypothetical protein
VVVTLPPVPPVVPEAPADAPPVEPALPPVPALDADEPPLGSLDEPPLGLTDEPPLLDELPPGLLDEPPPGLLDELIELPPDGLVLPLPLPPVPPWVESELLPELQAATKNARQTLVIEIRCLFIAQPRCKRWHGRGCPAMHLFYVALFFGQGVCRFSARYRRHTTCRRERESLTIASRSSTISLVHGRFME